MEKILTNDEGDLELANTVADGDKFRGTPNKTILLDRTDRLLKLGHVGLIIPGLHLEGDNGL